MLTQDDALKLAERAIAHDETITTQEILDSGAIPRLTGYIAKPGKVSDSIFGGKFTHEGQEYENPPLVDKNGKPLRIMVRSDRISTHDLNRGTIPFKDQVLAINHQYMRGLVAHLIGTSEHDLALPHNSIVIAAENLLTIPLEMVIRAYAAKSTTSTSLYQAYFVRGEKTFAGHKLPDDLIPNGMLLYPIDTPSTKAKKDETISPEEVVKRGICSEEVYQQIRNGTLRAFSRVSAELDRKGILLVDTKTEHGFNKRGEIVSQDELYTLDSSRFWLSADYAEQMRKLKAGEIKELNPKSYSKEFARGFSEGNNGYTPEQRILIAARYLLGIQQLTQQPFNPDTRKRSERVITGLESVLILAA